MPQPTPRSYDRWAVSRNGLHAPAEKEGRWVMGVRNGATPATGSDEGWDWTAGQPRSRSSWTQPLPRIKVVGVGDGGCTWVRRMSKHDVMGVEYIMVNTKSELPGPVVNVAEVVSIGSSTSPHWGTGRRSQVSELTVEDSEVQLRSAPRKRGSGPGSRRDGWRHRDKGCSLRWHAGKGDGRLRFGSSDYSL